MSNEIEQFSPGDRVKVTDSCFWAKGALGTIKQPPEMVIQSVINSSESWNGYSRQVKSMSGLLTFFWVEFDEPQLDSDDDGPYSEAEIQSDFLVKLN